MVKITIDLNSKLNNELERRAEANKRSKRNELLIILEELLQNGNRPSNEAFSKKPSIVDEMKLNNAFLN